MRNPGPVETKPPASYDCRVEPKIDVRIMHPSDAGRIYVPKSGVRESFVGRVMSFSAPFYRWRPHPWHGLEPGLNPPEIVHAYIEITPFDIVKYEIDKVTGYLKVDRPQRGSSQPPMLYGFIPQTICSRRVAALCPNAERCDMDPLDICVLSERPITRSEVIVNARVVGGLQCIDDDEADDKIIAVLRNDHVFSSAKDINDIPEALVERLQHYFSTYKMIPGEKSGLQIESVYGRDRALEVITASLEDYDEEFGRSPSS